MLKRSKKGISPLIATVLLIGFTVAVAAVIIIWSRNFVKEKAEKEGVLSEKRLQCENVEIDVQSINKNNREIVVENKGNEVLDGFILRVVSGGVGADKIIQKIEAAKTVTIKTSLFEGLGSNAKIDLIPALKPEGTNAPLVPCSNKHKVIKVE